MTVLVLCGIALLVMLSGQHDDDAAVIAGAIASADDVTDPPAGTWVVMLRQGVVEASPGLPAGASDEAVLRRSAEDRSAVTEDRVAGDREYRVRTEPRDGGALQVVLDLGRDHVQRTRLIESLVLVGAVGLLPAAGIGAWLGRRAMMPMANALALQRRFVADAGHELRTPVTLLSTRAQLIQRALLRRADVSSDVDKLVRDADQLAAILEDLLLAADPRGQATHEPVDLRGVVERVVETARSETRVPITFVPHERVGVLGSAAGLTRAVTALLDNAVRHADTGVVVTLRVDLAEAELDVTDDGPGIALEALPRLFDRFATTRTERAEGGRRQYGLGLALVSEIAARHGGTITAVTSDEGARFRLRLPALPGNSQNSATS
ncbi:sensor histidine kinase [Amycolatopsis decaplanina]|uniref:sensor histidine kinase n=1 Tax=Amycolatopsis decaplanina TaxID=208441 RepID=UPI001378520B|nr:HAMP domain-containing sensor histidine kinase [Amycolatopsis decaplanina]